ncbi:diguanylate cyclase [Oleiagrimonas sp. MCCC 1A03011]|jgi:diguanylate cyclase (GGDEF)-like protein|uniref:sensor domain-containing diguanylate cyclase n=1 Tax=Oleiagrimonas sp. MCCC 1A03011 TaxID=1926883 RepID=UPI000DDAF85D|nr:diguanylate cyclase [Oleiagrimonas sp. MCCC 1A03011]
MISRQDPHAPRPAQRGAFLRAAGFLKAHPILLHLGLILAWLLLWRLSALMQYAPHASLWFPPAGLSFAALLLIGWRAVPALMLCGVGATFWIDRIYQSHTPWRELLLTGVIFGVAHCASYGIGAGLLRRIIRRSTLHSLPGIIIAFLVLGCLAALSAAWSGVESLRVAGLLAASANHGLWLPWWVGDMAGVLVLTPLFLALISQLFPQIESWFGGLQFQVQPQHRWPYAGKLLVSVVLLSALMLTAAHFRQPEIAFGTFFLILPQMWVVYTETPFRSALSIAIFSTVLALWVEILGLIDQALVYQFAICVIAANTYFGLAVPVLLARNRKLSEMAFQDALTGACSKSHFFEDGERALIEARKYRLPAALIVLDIDRFKRINDEYDHAVGDQALIRVAETVRAHLRAADVFGRFGGDEFMLLLPGIGLQQALAAADRLRLHLQRTEAPGTSQTLSASFGVVELARGESTMQAFKRADRLLLQAKRDGRNRIGSAVPETTE